MKKTVSNAFANYICIILIDRALNGRVFGVCPTVFIGNICHCELLLCDWIGVGKWSSNGDSFLLRTTVNDFTAFLLRDSVWRFRTKQQQQQQTNRNPWRKKHNTEDTEINNNEKRKLKKNIWKWSSVIP